MNKSLLARTVFLFLLFFLLSPATVKSESVVEGVVAVITMNNRGKKTRQVIYFSDLERYHLFFQPVKEEINRKEQLKRVINHLLLRPEARRFVLEEPSREAVDARLSSIRRRFQDDRHFQAVLQKAGLLFEELELEIIEHLRVEKLIKERIKEFIFITPKAIERYYQEHPSLFPGRRLEEVEPVIQSILTGAKEHLKKEEYLGRLKEKVSIKLFLKQADSSADR